MSKSGMPVDAGLSSTQAGYLANCLLSSKEFLFADVFAESIDVVIDFIHKFCSKIGARWQMIPNKKEDMQKGLMESGLRALEMACEEVCANPNDVSLRQRIAGIMTLLYSQLCIFERGTITRV